MHGLTIVHFLNTLFVSASLSIDACVVAMTFGLAGRTLGTRRALIVGSTFGVMGAVMPLIGASAGSVASSLFMRFDHWIAFGVLAALGIKSLLDARRQPGLQTIRFDGFSRLLVAALATSIDSLAAGFSFVLVKEPIAPLALCTAAITTCGCTLSFLFATRLGARSQRVGLLVGGVVLIAIACEILREHAGHL